ncbi:site-specific DNA-methyltransferase [Prevotella sp. PCHR]|uniref:site-specific DNA-methyltransferase (adenine-specific) n=1 Tax=Xylanibacter caecicola TaxID=2736294 RepID=A0ABX2B351_9BACT|nr:site-specific DNA-methyltransferase [Xylanibacter caecicola]NPE25934.1 site-specific DNA-methyltransferase [Xylanibacter caecicola]
MEFSKLELQSADGAQLNIEALYQIVPSVFTEARDPKTGEVSRKVNFEALRRLLGDNTIESDSDGECYQFTWVGKNAAKAEAARSTDKTLRPVPEDSVDWENTKNLYIEGDNLEVLKLLQRSYMGKVKMIYIDPPYNTGNDFVYDDDFARTAAEEDLEAGNVDELGLRYRKNTDSNGKFHSDWCSMIYPRLLVARLLLTEDGVIFISIDDNEVRNLRNICDEVFGAGNFVATLVWERAFSPKNDAKFISNSHDYIVMYAKNINNFTIGRLPRTEEANARYSNPDNDPRGPWMSSDISVKTYNSACDYPITTPSGRVVEPPAGRCWSLSPKAFGERLRENRIWFGPNGDNTPRIKRFLSELKFEGMAPTSILFYKEVGHSQEGAQEVVSLFGDKGVFDGPKPVRLMQRLITLANLQENSIVLDFFSGSASTAHALMKTNAEKSTCCKFIMVQLPEEVSESKKNQDYATIPEIGKERIRRAGKKIKEESPLTTQDLDTGFRVFRLDESNYEEVSKSPKEYNQDQLALFADNIKADRTDLDLLFGAMLAWGVALDLPMISETVDGCTIYTVNDGDLVACFSKDITDSVVTAMAGKTPLRVLFRDSCFTQDAQKINIYEQFKQLMDWTDDEAFKNIKVI